MENAVKTAKKKKRQKEKVFKVNLKKSEIQGIIRKLEEGHDCLLYPGDPDLLIEYGCDLHDANDFIEKDFCNDRCKEPKKFETLKRKLKKLIKEV